MIIVTGAAGFIGSAFVWQLNTMGIEDIIVSDKLRTEDKWLNLAKRKYYDWVDKDELFNYLETTDGVHGMTICHYPLLTWKNAGRTYMVHGHIHADTNSDYWPLIQRRERVLNAGVDVNDYRPVTFEEMVENNRKFKAAHAGQDCAHNADETAKN